MTDGGHRRVQYALIIGAILVGSVVAAIGFSTIDGLLKVKGNIVCSGDMNLDQDLLVGSTGAFTGNLSTQGTMAVTSTSAFSDSIYCAKEVRVDSVIVVRAIRLVEWSGALPDTTNIRVGFTVLRGDSLYTLGNSKGGWVTEALD